MFGGSMLYHLETPESDIDERGVFMHTEPAYILGTKRFDEDRRQDPNIQQDIVVKELSHYCSLLARGNTEALELLFCKESEFRTITPKFRLIRDNREHLVDSKLLFCCLRGYIQGERRLMNGERKGQIGGKRFAVLQQLGYSPKNAVQLLRLAQTGIEFFKNGQFIVDSRDFGTQFHTLLMDIKTNGQKFTKQEVNNLVDELETQLVEAYENKNFTFYFNETMLNDLLLDIYMSVLKNHEKR